MRDFFTLEVMKYWAPTAAMSAEHKKQHLAMMAESGEYLWSEKKDGNFCRGVVTAERNALQTRGISKLTGTYSELQDKVFFWDDVVNAFQNSGTTVLLGELYLPGGIDRDVGAIARCQTIKARARQKTIKLEWHIFDVLAYDGIDLVDEPIEKRITYIKPAVERINSPYVKAIEYHEMTPKFFEEVNEIFENGGEGVVCYKKGEAYTAGKRSSAWTTCKVKQEISGDVDVFIIGTEPPIKDYTGKEIGSWQYWMDDRTGEKLRGPYYMEYQMGRSVRPITKGYYYNLPGAIYVGVYDKNHSITPICKVAGLTDEFKMELRDNYKKWDKCPLTIGGMMISNAGAIPSIRHPYIRSFREHDLTPDDCTLDKIIS